MEHQKIVNLLNEANDSEFVTRKWNVVNDNSKSNYGARNEIMFNTKVLKYNISLYNDAQILASGDNTITCRNLASQVAFKSWGPFTKFIRKTDETTTDDAV